MKTLYAITPEIAYKKQIFSSEEVKKALLESKPKGLKILPYSDKKLCILISEMNEDKISYRYDSATDKSFKPVSWDNFYKVIKIYLNDIEFAE